LRLIADDTVNAPTRNYYLLCARELEEQSEWKIGPVAVWCRPFDSMYCNKGDWLWDWNGRTNFGRMRCAALTSGLTRKQVADDPPAWQGIAQQCPEKMGVGMSTLNKWITVHRDTDVVSKEDLGLAQENDLLRRENRILKEGRDILKKATQFFASQKPLSHM
jgi:transposase